MAANEHIATAPVEAPPPAPRASGSPPRPGVGSLAAKISRDALGSNLGGPFHDELRGAQRDVILQRTVVLIWISVFVMPTTIWSFM